MKRDTTAIFDPENEIPSREPTIATERIEREIRNGLITDRVDLEAALRSWEYEQLPPDTIAALRDRFPEGS